MRIEKGLFFEYEVSPHRRNLTRISDNLGGRAENAADALAGSSSRSADQVSYHAVDREIEPQNTFRQIRSTGQVNPLKLPLHVETVLIGRALGQEAGYVAGVGFRIRDDGYVEGEFSHGVEKFDSFSEFVRCAKRCMMAKRD